MSELAPDATARLRLVVARIALAAAALTFVVIVASAFMRHTQAGLACADWPACYARMESAGSEAAPSSGVRAARLAHRIAATGVLALIIGMLLVAWTQKPPWKREGYLALVALVVAAALAVLGIATPGARLPAITLGNLLGGYLMLALLAATAAAARHGTGSVSPSGLAARPLRWGALAVLILLFLQTASGGMIGAQYALPACPTLGGCAGFSLEQLLAGGALDPMRALSIVDDRVAAPAGAAGLHVIHRLLGIVAAVATLMLAYRLRQADRRAARVLVVLAVGAVLLGVAAIAGMPSLPLTVLHNATAAVLVATLAYHGAKNRRS
jgi:cytochrome c oxidase assembly protein subunit 15